MCAGITVGAQHPSGSRIAAVLHYDSRSLRLSTAQELQGRLTASHCGLSAGQRLLEEDVRRKSARPKYGDADGRFINVLVGEKGFGLTTDGYATMELTRRTGTSKISVWPF